MLCFTGNCVAPLGMKDRRIEDNQISASSEFEGKSDNYFSAKYARLDNQSGKIGNIWMAGGWVAGEQDVNQWIQVIFDVLRNVAGIITQGRITKNPDREDEWVSEYKVKYSNDEGDSLQYVKDTNGQNEEVRYNMKYNQLFLTTIHE